MALASGDSYAAASPPSVHPATNASSAALDYEQPKLLTGTIYERGPEPRRVLFKFRRTGSRSGSRVAVLREYTHRDRSLAARERVAYENGRLVSFELEELQSGAKGQALLRPDPAGNGKEIIKFAYSPGPGAKTITSTENLRKDVLVNDMLPGFLFGHWDELMKGAAVKFRVIVLQRRETIGFKLVKESDSTWQGRPVVIIRMEPSSAIIAHLLEPVRFTVEQGRRRILQYSGRTTPMIKRGNKWEDLDAASVFDWD
jgi:hypothetical protein